VRLLADRRPGLPWLGLCDLPTPVRALPGLHERLWMKDDSRTSALWGGNKPRKLEWVLGDARRRGRDTVLTFGALGTNHGLATALHARAHGMRCVLCLVDQPLDAHVAAQLERLRASGAELHFTRDARHTALALPRLLVRHRLPYLLPAGGSSPVGALGFVEAGFELAAQVERGELPEPAAVWCALGTGGTAAGLLVGLRMAGLLRTRVRTVHVNDQLRLSERTVLRLARRTARRLRTEPPRDGVEVVHGYLGGGYGHATPEAAKAIALARDAEALTLDPVYTGKTMAALLDRIDREDGPVVYWHTYASPTPAPLSPPTARSTRR
jgi:D-cysteine desulfhydrase